MTGALASVVAGSAVGLPRIGYGAAALGNLFSEVDDDTAAATVSAAWDAGVRHFDVAPHYGLGLAERRLGRSLARYPRDEFVVSTKAGRLLLPSPETADRRDDMGFDVPADVRRVWDLSEEGIRRSLDESLGRMGLDRVDVLYLHDPEEAVTAERSLDDVLNEALPALSALRDEGTVRAVGVGSKSVPALLAAVRSGRIDVVMVAGRYTLLEQPALAELLPECRERGVEVVAAGVFNSGALAQAIPSPDAPYEYGSMPDGVYRRVLALAESCAAHGSDLPTAALAFPFLHPAVTSVVVGARSPEQVTDTLARCATPVPRALWEALGRDGLLPAAALPEVPPRHDAA